MNDNNSAFWWRRRLTILRQALQSRFRWIALSLAVFFGIIFFGLAALTQQPVHITVLMQALEATQWQNIVEQFERENPDIRLDIGEGPNATNLVEDL